MAGDMNAHSTMWDGRAIAPRNHTFWENLIVDHELATPKKQPGMDLTHTDIPSSTSPSPRTTSSYDGASSTKTTAQDQITKSWYGR